MCSREHVGGKSGTDAGAAIAERGKLLHLVFHRGDWFARAMLERQQHFGQSYHRTGVAPLSS